MAVELHRETLRRIEQHGAEDYPNESCGILVGKEDEGRKVVTDILPLRNSRPGQDPSGDRPETLALLREIYALLQNGTYKPDPIREWLRRADAAVNSARNRFLITPEDFVQSEREARRRGVDILGFYHSHPDHPARPSEYDREHAWPWYTYLISKVDNGIPQETTAWVLSEDRLQFVPEQMTISGDG